MTSKIYTKTGDKGLTSLIGASRIPKNNIQIEAYGTIDELNAHIGILISQNHSKNMIQFLINLQNQLFNIGSLLACEPEKKSLFNLPIIEQNNIENIEQEIDKMTLELPPLKNFILPSGSLEIAQIHLARCVCRRAERCIVAVINANISVDSNVVIFINRLSDYLFILARFVALKNNITEVHWKK